MVLTIRLLLHQYLLVIFLVGIPVTIAALISLVLKERL